MSTDHILEDIGSKFRLFPLQLLVRSDPPPAHFLCNFQKLISLQLVKLIKSDFLEKLIFLEKNFLTYFSDYGRWKAN